MSFNVVSIDEQAGTMIIDWGWTVLNHNIPDIFLQKEVDPEETKRIIRSMEPERPTITKVSQSLKDLVHTEADVEESSLIKPDFNEDVSEDTDATEI